MKVGQTTSFKGFYEMERNNIHYELLKPVFQLNSSTNNKIKTLQTFDTDSVFILRNDSKGQQLEYFEKQIAKINKPYTQAVDKLIKQGLFDKLHELQHKVSKERRKFIKEFIKENKPLKLTYEYASKILPDLKLELPSNNS